MTKKTPENWRDRERERQNTRTMPVWRNESFWTEHAARHTDHFVHLSALNPPLLAYTVDEDKGTRDIQTQIKAGRYLARYFSDVLTAKQIAYLAAWQANGTKPQGEVSDSDVKFATTEEEIVYTYHKGPRSCMDGLNFPDAATSPVRVYAAGDLAVAYLEGEAPPNRPGFTVLARALVWPDRKVMGRIYPTEGAHAEDGYGSDHAAHMANKHALEHKLKEMGYRSVYEGASFNGARLLRLKREYGGLTMPYLDNDYTVDDNGDEFIMRDEGKGEYTAQETSGCLGPETEREEEYDFYCERCEEGCYGNSRTVVVSNSRRNGYFTSEVSWCEHCADHYTFQCSGFDVTCSEDISNVEVDGETYSLAYADENFTMSDYSGEWFDPDSDPRVEMENGEVWMESEFSKHGFTCKITGQNYSYLDMHGTYEGISENCTDEEIAEYLAQHEKESVE